MRACVHSLLCKHVFNCFTLNNINHNHRDEIAVIENKCVYVFSETGGLSGALFVQLNYRVTLIRNRYVNIYILTHILYLQDVILFCRNPNHINHTNNVFTKNTS